MGGSGPGKLCPERGSHPTASLPGYRPCLSVPAPSLHFSTSRRQSSQGTPGLRACPLQIPGRLRPGRPAPTGQRDALQRDGWGSGWAQPSATPALPLQRGLTAAGLPPGGGAPGLGRGSARPPPPPPLPAPRVPGGSAAAGAGGGAEPAAAAQEGKFGGGRSSRGRPSSPEGASG